MLKTNLAFLRFFPLCILFMYSCSHPTSPVVPEPEPTAREVIADVQITGRYNDVSGRPVSLDKSLSNLRDQPDGYQVAVNTPGRVTSVEVACNGKNVFCNDAFTFSIMFPGEGTGSHQIEAWGESTTNGIFLMADGREFGSSNGLLQISFYSETHIEGNFNGTFYDLKDNRVSSNISGKFSLKR